MNDGDNRNNISAHNVGGGSAWNIVTRPHGCLGAVFLLVEIAAVIAIFLWATSAK